MKGLLCWLAGAMAARAVCTVRALPVAHRETMGPREMRVVPVE